MRRLLLIALASLVVAASGLAATTLPATAEGEPVITSMTTNSSAIYPYWDGYRDSISIKVYMNAPYDAWDVASLDIVSDSTGETVSTLTPVGNYLPYGFSWRGRATSGEYVPAGVYTLRARVTDSSNNMSEFEKKVTVVREKIEHRTFRKIVTAYDSSYGQYVGRCSTLRRPSLRGWFGSFGLYSNTKCTKTFDASYISTVHRLEVPASVTAYGFFQVSPYSGAAKAAPRSLAYLEYHKNNNDWRASTRLGVALTRHPGERVYGDKFVKEGHVTWGVYTARGARYDLKDFKVTIEYSALIPE